MIAVTGATGELGGRVARGLSERGAPIRLVVGDPSRAPALPGAEVVANPGGYEDGEGLRRALDGVETVFLVSAREIEGWVTSYLAVANGEFDAVTDDVERLTGRRPMSLDEYLAASPATWAHLAA